MAYLNLDLDYFNHPKTSRLVGLLGRGAAELPIRVWCYCGKYHTESGSLASYSAQEIEAVANWWGKPGEMVKAMIKVGFLKAVKGSYQVNDWKVHSGHLVYFKKRAKLGAARKWRERLQDLNKEKRSRRLSKSRQIATHTKDQWLSLKTVLDNVCVRCLVKEEQVEIVKDHIVPIYQGGSDGLENLQPLCRKCNASKGPESIDHRLSYLKSKIGNLKYDKEIGVDAEGLLKRLLDACLMPAPNVSFPLFIKERGHSPPKIPPNLEDVKAAFKQRGYPLEAEKFFYYHASRGWRVGKLPMKNWWAAMMVWLKNGKRLGILECEKLVQQDDYAGKVKLWAKEAVPPPADAVVELQKLNEKFGLK